MATAATPTLGTLSVEDADPFVSAISQDSKRHRYSAFDSETFSSYTNGSPTQTRRALEAHLNETERRLAEASQLGTVLLQQKEELVERLKEVEGHQETSDIGPELKKKLLDLEKEFNEVGRETARAFIPRSRVPSGETSETYNGGAVLTSQAGHSPTKMSVPSARKIRNQQPSRINDIELATEISSSLLAQVRELQVLLAEKDEALRSVNAEKSHLEVEFEGLMQRLRALDESEQRYKDENWSLETQLHELLATSKEAADREARLTQTLNNAKSEKSAIEREFEELKQLHAKLSDDHTATSKQHESELSNLRRNVSMAESERGALQRKIDELTSQNQDLAKAVAYRFRAEEQAAAQETASDTDGADADQTTPEGSPPPSPNKATPRHGQLESETLKSSLHHAHRMIQNLKNNIHREKTEKLELKRMLQDARDELETNRGGNTLVNGSAGKRRGRKEESEGFKKPLRPERLGAARNSRDEIIMGEPDWEDHDDLATPSRPRQPKREGSGSRAASGADTSTDAFETATENEDAFETATEREGGITETDAFHTGAETLDGDSSDEQTETEGRPSTASTATASTTRARRPSPFVASRERNNSYMSTASTSGDEFDEMEIRTPSQPPHQRYRLKIGRGGSRRSIRGNDAITSTPSTVRDSPASSFVSNGSQTRPGPSLFAELGDMSDGESEEGSAFDGTPSRSSVAGSRIAYDTPRKSSIIASPPSMRPLRPFIPMVDSGMMTEPWEPEPKSVISKITEPLSAALAGAAGFEIGKSSVAKTEPPVAEAEPAPQVPVAESDAPATEKVVVPISTSEQSLQTIAPILSLSPIAMLDTVPVELPVLPEPVKEVIPLVIPTNVFKYSSVVTTMDAEPESPIWPKPAVFVPEPVVKPQLSFSGITHQATEPVEPSPQHIIQSTPVVVAPVIDDKPVMSKKQKSEPQIAEDETSQPPRALVSEAEEALSKPTTSSASSRAPLQPIAANGTLTERDQENNVESALKPLKVETTDGSTQTQMSAEEIERLLKTRNQSPQIAITPIIQSPLGSPGRVRHEPSSPKKAQIAEAAPLKGPRRPGSAGSTRSRNPPPPLPADHKEVIAAAVQKSPSSRTGSMGPPIMPASAYRTNSQTRPRTPGTSPIPLSPASKESNTPRPKFSSVRSGASTPATRRSSASSFASELDQRFNITTNGAVAPDHFDAQTTDPRMIQAITQTMIGEYLWKYTRKAGRDEFSENRHRRFFWVHPYTRTLYWSDQDPATAGKTQLKAKSVAIEAVQVVTDDNPSPPGLHRKSIIVVTPGRSIKFTATTGQRHETWFNALSYLLLRSNPEQTAETAQVSEDIDEFNPSYGRSTSRQTGRSQASLSSYHSRTTRTASPHRAQIPSLNTRQPAQRASVTQTTPVQGSLSGRLSSLGGMFRPGSAARGSFSSRRSRTSGQEDSVYDNSAIHDSAEDLRQVIAQQEHELDRLENVRACCDGKHDVGTLSHKARPNTLTNRNSIGYALGSLTQSRRESHGASQHLHNMDPANHPL